MTWANTDVANRVAIAIQNGDADVVRTELQNNPDCLRTNDGFDHWLSFSVQLGHLEIVKVLVELGLNVDEPDGDGPGPALPDAARCGHTDVVEWLLSNGAKLNHVHRGVTACPALRAAAAYGQLETVKLLVERDAEINGAFGDANPLMAAKQLGHSEIARFLVANGAKDLRELTPPDYASAHAEIIRYMEESFGELSAGRTELRTTPTVNVLHIRASIDEDYRDFDGHALFTIGASDVFLPSDDDEFACLELELKLHSGWNASGDEWNHAVKWVTECVDGLIHVGKIGRQPLLFGDFKTPLCPGTEQVGWVGGYQQGYFISPDYRRISLLSLHAIYASEVKCITQHGTEEFLDRLRESGVSSNFDPTRRPIRIH